MRALFIAAIAAGLPLGAYATGTFSGSEPGGQVDRITGTIEGTTYDGSIYLTNNDQRIEVAVGTPNFMMKRGLPFAALAVGKTVTVDAYDSASDNSDRLYARRIVIDGRIINLKT
jgi:hypothetical protein